ncbi:MAG: hypothetical protein JWQ11_1470 [Rhizobacter sp.]|nr:hypothetical protein [Rhizobacter sp.]
MNVKNAIRAVVGFSLVLATAATSAGTLILGSFEGVATGSRVYSADPTRTNFDGEEVSGTFSIDTSVPLVYTSLQPDSSFNVTLSTAIGMTVHADGQTVTFGKDSPYGVSSFLSLTTSGAIPVVGVTVDGGDPYHNAYIMLAGALFDNLDVASLHAGPVDLSDSSISFMGGRFFGSGIALTSLALTSPVPEPATEWLMGIGLAVLTLASTRWRGRTSTS